MLDIKATTES